MEKRKLSKIPEEKATEKMLELARRLQGNSHIVKASLLEDKKILLLNFYEIKSLKNGKTGAAFRTFLSDSDYITQDMKTSKVKWLTASFEGMRDFSLYKYCYDRDYNKSRWECRVFINTDEEQKMIEDFFEKYKKPDDEEPWPAVCRFQDEVKRKRLAEKHRKVTDKIDEVMEPVKDAPKEFNEWIWKTGMSFSRYLIYKEIQKDVAQCKCTHCGKSGKVSRKSIRLRNNEKGECPFCGSRVTIKAEGKLAATTNDERWFLYVNPTKEGVLLRYFKAYRLIRKNYGLDMERPNILIEEFIYEYSRAFYDFSQEQPHVESYEWGVYKQHGLPRWCPDMGLIPCMECILYPNNLPEAWEHTPMKYSALEVLSSNIPTVALRYEDAIRKYLKFPKLEWVCKMGLNSLAKDIIRGSGYSGMVGKVNYQGNTIYEILGLTKVNTRILQEIDGNNEALRLLQVSQQIGFQFKTEQLREYYETFQCNTDLLKQANRKVSLHKLVKYIAKESERYPLGNAGGCWQYSYMRYREREDPRIERKQNMAKDWLEYLDWCKALKYDLDNMFIYMPKNFKAVHDRTAIEYQELQDKKAAAEKRRREREARRRMKETKKAMEEIFSNNEGTDAFSIKGKGLILIVPKSGDEIRNEGAKLHHCVGGYVERVARGETNIFFVRKTEEPETPYYTMEWNNNHIVQCRGSHNCGMTPEVEAFVKVFEKKMQASIKKKEEKKHGKASCA